MKFLCPSCKAKYQIADEKVAGRSVRMKCRKCGFMIQVSSASAAPATDSDIPEAPNDIELSAPLPSVVEAKPPEPKAPTPKPAEVKAPEKSAPLGSPPAPRAAPGKPPTARGSAVPAPRPPPGKPVGAVPKPASPPRATAPQAPSSPSASRTPGVAPVAAPKPTIVTAAPAAPSAPTPAPKDVPRDFEDEDEVTRMADAGALAGAFTQAFGSGGTSVAPAAVDGQLSMPGDEWFVGINGVPVGPIRLSELRSKAASGAVSKESLVWRDGFEDWRPLKTYPELLAIVEEGVSSARASLTPFTPPASEARDVTAKPVAAAALAESFPSATSPSAVTGSAVVTDDLAGLVPPRRGTSPMVWVALVIAIALGLTLGFVLFGGQKAETKIVEKIVEKEVPAKGAEQAAPVAANNPGETMPADPAVPKKSGGTGKAGGAATPEGDGKPVTGLKGLNGLSGLGPASGPNTGGPSGATAGGGAQLDGSQIQSTVARYTGAVKRRCWQPALDARARDAPMTAKVTVTITVGPTGTVQNATTSGEPRGYGGLASCIASSVRTWQFPASGGTTVANVPFVFAGQ